MKGMYVSVICWLIIVDHGFAVPEGIPPDVFKAQRDGYLYADYPGVFDDAEGDGITIEAWIYLTDKPKDGDYWDTSEGHWFIIGKPGGYFVTITGRDLSLSIQQRDPEGTAYVYFGVQSTDGKGSASSGGQIRPRDFPLRRWAHIAFQLVVKRDGTHDSTFFDRELFGGFSTNIRMGRVATPLMIGGATPVTFRNGLPWGDGYESMKGYIDEVRISKGLRYETKGKALIRPRARFRLDEQTIALWHFDEGPGSRIYRDSSGNDYHLFPGGSLAVDSRGKLATTWGSLKRRVQEAK